MPDYIIVGGGSAGCVMAARLSEDRDISVLLLEAGPRDTDPYIHMPVGFFKMTKVRQSLVGRRNNRSRAQLRVFRSAHRRPTRAPEFSRPACDQSIPAVTLKRLASTASKIDQSAGLPRGGTLFMPPESRPMYRGAHREVTREAPSQIRVAHAKYRR